MLEIFVQLLTAEKDGSLCKPTHFRVDMIRSCGVSLSVLLYLLALQIRHFVSFPELVLLSEAQLLHSCIRVFSEAVLHLSPLRQ